MLITSWIDKYTLDNENIVYWLLQNMVHYSIVQTLKVSLQQTDPAILLVCLKLFVCIIYFHFIIFTKKALI